MKETFGSDWEQAWDAANALAQRDSGVVKVLVETVLGADRKTVITRKKRSGSVLPAV